MKRIILLLLVVFALGACIQTPVPASDWDLYQDGSTLTRLEEPRSS